MNLRAFHLDFNSAAFRPDAVEAVLRAAAAASCNAILWEVEDKVRWETCPEAVHPDAYGKDEFRRLVALGRSLGLEPIPLLQTFGHAEYVLQNKALASLRELPGEYDCYCASNPEVRLLLCRWIAEYRDLFGPVRFFHLGGDEAYHFGKCPRCASRDRIGLYAEHLLAVSADLRRDGVKVCIWDDFSRKSTWWSDSPGGGDDAGHDISPLRPFALWNWEYSPSATFSHAAELAADGFDTVVAGSASCRGDDPFLPDWSSHLRNIAAMRRASEAPGVAGWCITSWSVRYGLKRLQAPMLAPDPEAAIAAAVPGLAPDAALRAICLAGTAGGCLPTFLAQIWARYKDSRLPPPGWLAGRLADPACAADAEALRQRIPELIAGLDEATAAISAAMRASGCSDAESPSFPALVIEGATLKRYMLSALGAALGIAGFQSPSSDALQSCLERTFHYYSIEMTPSTARRAAEIAWNPLIDYWG